jgi:hypothetical protein
MPRWRIRRFQSSGGVLRRAREREARRRRRRRYAETVILDFALGLVAIVAAWMSARRWSQGYAARYGRRPPTGWMFTRVNDVPLERERRILIVILVLAIVVSLSVLSRAYRL